MSPPLIAVKGLCAQAEGGARLLDGIDLHAGPGEVVTVVGPSGSGKTTLGLALQGESEPGIHLSGHVFLRGADLLALTDRRRRGARAGRIGHLPQHPATVLNPARRVGAVLEELAALRNPQRRARAAAVAAAVHDAQLGAEPDLLRRFPHQLSGGQQQRVALAQAMVTRPGLLVLDEPTTALDPVARAAAADALAGLAEAGTAVVLFTHDPVIARILSHRVCVLDGGRIVERGPGPRSLHAPEQSRARLLPVLAPQTRAVPARSADAGVDAGVDAAAHEGVDAAVDDAAPAGRSLTGGGTLRVRGLNKSSRGGTPILSGVDLDLPEGRCVTLVGRSGAGKTTLARCIAGLDRPDSGNVLLGDDELPARAARRGPAQLRRIQYVHQDARASFDPFRTVAAQVARTGERLRGLTKDTAREEAGVLLGSLGLRAADVARRPAQLSGGQLQRAALARALMARPSVLICDEITASLDTAAQQELVQLLARVRSGTGTGLILITHDPDAVAGVAEERWGMEQGRIRTAPGRVGDFGEIPRTPDRSRTR